MLNDIYNALDPIAFEIGPFVVRWYGIGYILGILLGGLLIVHLCKRWKIKFNIDALLTLFIAAVLGIILGARFGYILFYGEGYYFEHPELIFAFNQGGMSFHGGVLGMVLALFITSKIIKMPFSTLGDLVVIVAPIGICLVRIANFINGELWGAPTDLPWGVEFESGGGIARHPSQLYEAALEGVVMFIVLMTLARRKPPLPRGSYMGVFLTLYGIFRIAVEFVREPDAHIGYLAGGWLTMGMVLCIPMILIGVALLIYAAKTKHPQEGMLYLADEAVEADETTEPDAKDPDDFATEEDADNPATEETAGPDAKEGDEHKLPSSNQKNEAEE